MKKKSARRIKRDAAFQPYNDWQRGEPCDAIEAFPSHVCDGPVQQAHLRDHTGLGLKELPTSTLRLCMGAHDDYDGRRRPSVLFTGLTLDEKKDWMKARIALQVARFEARTRRRSA
jgi:hypothetical protein